MSDAGDASPTSGSQPGKTAKERVDRALRELREEIRVVLPVWATALVTLAVSLAVYVVVATVVDGGAAAVVAVGNAGWFTWFWFGVPLLRRPSER